MMSSERDRESRMTDGWLPPAVSYLAGIFVACLLLASAVVHLDNPYALLDSIYGYRLLPRVCAEPLANLLPFLHLTVALLLIAGWARRAAFCVGVGVFLLYTVAQGIALARGLDVKCGCFGAAHTVFIGPVTIAIAVSGLATCLLGCWGTRDRLTTLPAGGVDLVKPAAETVLSYTESR